MKSHNTMSRFVSDYGETGTMADLKALVGDFCTTFNFSFLTYFAVDAPMVGCEGLLLTNYPKAWETHYFEHQYQSVDPVLHVARNRLIPLNWSELPPLRGVAENFFDDARAHGLGRQGMTVPVRGQFGELVLLSLNANMSEREWESVFDKSIADITYFSYLLHQRVQKAVGIGETAPPRLSPREAEVMRWAVRGKSAWETAQLTGLSERTVQFYMRNICAKLEVATKIQAVARVTREHLIPY